MEMPRREVKLKTQSFEKYTAFLLTFTFANAYFCTNNPPQPPKNCNDSATHSRRVG
jgi:hypothetical protein